MKQMVCEMCGGTDLVKKDGVFVCQTCGTKYSIEEARKMMIEGNVDVSGSTVKVDDSDKIENYLMMAQNAYDAGNQKEAENYCNKIIETEPDNYQAWLLKGKAAGWQSTLRKIRIEESVSAFNKALDNAPEENLEETKKKIGVEIIKLCLALMKLCCDNFEKYPSEENAKEIEQFALLSQMYALKLVSRCGQDLEDFKSKVAILINISCVAAWEDVIKKEYERDTHPSSYEYEKYFKRSKCLIALTQIAIDLSDNDDKEDVRRYKNMITYLTALINSCSYKFDSYGGYTKDLTLSTETKNNYINKIMEYHKKIKEIDPTYEIPQNPQNTIASSGGCYVATAVYGSYDCPEVWTLRRYRDKDLAATWHGRAFIYIYYAISPTLVKWFGHTVWFKKMWRGKLDHMVKKLQDKGYEDTPYEDKEW